MYVHMYVCMYVSWNVKKHVLSIQKKKKKIMGQDPSIVLRGGPSIWLMVLHLIAPGTNDEALQ